MGHLKLAIKKKGVFGPLDNLQEQQMCQKLVRPPKKHFIKDVSLNPWGVSSIPGCNSLFLFRDHTSWVELPSLGLCLPPDQSEARAQISTPAAGLSTQIHFFKPLGVRGPLTLPDGNQNKATGSRPVGRREGGVGASRDLCSGI